MLDSLQTMGTSSGIQRPLSIHPRIEFGWIRMVPIFFPGPLPYIRNTRNMPFFSWSNRKLSRGKCHFSANVAEVIRVIYALLGHFYKYTTQSVTIECQLKLSRHNSHERTWGHHLQYDRFRTTLNKNRRKLTGNILLITWPTPTAKIADHVISSWYENYCARLKCCEI